MAIGFNTPGFNGSSSGVVLDNKFTALGTISRVDDTFTFSLGYAWQLNGGTYANINTFDYWIEKAGIYKFRSDIVFVNQNNEILYLKGVEDDVAGIPPAVPVGCMLLGTWSIYDDNISDIDIVPLGNLYVQKSFFNEKKVKGSTNYISIDNNNGEMAFVFNGAKLPFNFYGFVDYENNPYLFDGKIVSLKNNTPYPITLKHQTGVNNIQFNFSSGADFVLQTGEILQLRYSQLRGLEISNNQDNKPKPITVSLAQIGADNWDEVPTKLTTWIADEDFNISDIELPVFEVVQELYAENIFEYKTTAPSLEDFQGGFPFPLINLRLGDSKTVLFDNTYYELAKDYIWNYNDLYSIKSYAKTISEDIANDWGNIFEVEMPYLKVVPNNCFRNCPLLTEIRLPKATTFGEFFGSYNTNLYYLSLPKAKEFGISSLRNSSIATLLLPEATTFGNNCILSLPNLMAINMPKATTFGSSCIRNLPALTDLALPNAITFGNRCLYQNSNIESYNLPKGETFGENCLTLNNNLISINLPLATLFGFYCISKNPKLFEINLPNALSFGDESLSQNDLLETINLPSATNISFASIGYNISLKTVSLPVVSEIFPYLFANCESLENINIPMVDTMANSSTIFAGITGNDITLTVKTALMTSNAGLPPTPIQNLIADNTVTVITV